MNSEDGLKIATQFWSSISDQKWIEVKQLLSNDFEAYWPQSKEKIIGAENFIAVNSNYPGTHKIKLCDICISIDPKDKVSFDPKDHLCSNPKGHITKVITEVYIESKMPDGKIMQLFAISTFKIMNDKIFSLREYWADTYPAPDWRKQWVEID